jgi:hypothetical protein
MKSMLKGIAPCATLLLIGCGDLSMPDAGSSIRRTSADRNRVPASNELEFDLAKCGFDLTKPTETISSRRMSMVPKKISIPRLLWTETYTISGMSIVEESLSRSIVTYSAQSTPASTLDQVNAQLGALSAGFTADLLKLEERAKIGSLHSDWRGVFCSLQPAIRLEHGMTDKVAVEFDKPLPINPLVIADVSRLMAEMGSSRSWSGITAKVSDSLNPEIPIGSTWSGRVTSGPVSPVVDIEGPAGPMRIQAEFAVKLSYDFGSPAANRSMGLPNSVTWYVDSSTNMFKLTQIDFGDGAIVNYLPDR